MSQIQNSTATDIFVASQADEGVVPSNPSFKKMNTVSGRLTKTVGFVKSNTIKTDGQSTRNIRDNVTFNSEIAFELDRGIQDLMASALRVNSLPDLVSLTAATIAFDSTNNQITDSANGLSVFEQGTFVFVTGSSTAALNREYFVESVAGGALTLKAGEISLDASAGDNITITSRSFKSGKTPRFMVFQERESRDGGTDFTSQIDCLINTLNITVPTSGVITCTIGVVANRQLDGTSAIPGQGDITSPDPDSFNPVSNLDMIWAPDQARDTTPIFTEVTMEINSNSEAVPGAGVEGAIANSINNITVNGTLNSITRSDAPRVELTKQQEGTVFSMSYVFTFSDGEKMVVTMRRMLYTEGSRERATNVVSNFAGTYDAETIQGGSTMQVDFSY